VQKNNALVMCGLVFVWHSVKVPLNGYCIVSVSMDEI